MTDYILKGTDKKGYGIFAGKVFKKGEHIFHDDLRGLKKYTLAELKYEFEVNPEHKDHDTYVGHGKYVVEVTPTTYMNHSCDPNCYLKMRSIAVYDVYALRDIVEGEELTQDYTASAVDQFAGQGFWIMECKCESANCRKKVTGDFFEMPEEWQVMYYPFLPPSIKRKWKDRFRHLKNK